jgi:uncharacterized protein
MFMTISIKDIEFKVKPVLTNKDIQQGMMNKKFDNSFDGMLFFMNDGPHCFWMKNCVIDLDIIFIENNTITKIHHSCEPCKKSPCENYCGNGDLILELEGGSCYRLGIQEGNKVIF